MKILLVTNSFNLGGAETHVLELALFLKRNMCDVTVASSGGIYEFELRKNNIKHVSLPLDQSKIACVLECYTGLKKLIKNEKFDIVHAHARIPAFICDLLSKELDFIFITTCHAIFQNNKIKKRLSRWGTHVFSISEDVDKYLIQTYNVPYRSINRAINGINTEKYTKKAPIRELIDKYNLRGKRVIYTASRLENDVCLFIDNCIKSFISLSYDYPNLVYIISGGGEKLEYYKQVAKEINNRFNYKKIIVTGPVYNVYDYLNLSEIFIGPSRAALESISSKVLTIVSGDQGHIGLFNKEKIKECIETNFTGRGRQIAKEDVYYRELEYALNLDKDKKSEILNFGREFINENYSVEIMGNQYLEKYKELCGYTRESSAVICGYYGNNNIGDEMMLSSFIDYSRGKIKTKNYSVITSNPIETKMKFKVNTISKFDFKNIENEIRKTKLLIYAGGNILQDKTSIRSLKYYDYLHKIAKNNDAKIQIVANGIGPLNSIKSRRIVEKIILDSDYISLRDVSSYEYVKRIKNENVYLTSDLTSTYEQINMDETIIDEKYFVFCPKKEDVDESKLSHLINSIKEKYSYQCIIIPMHYKQDMKISKNIAKNTNSILFDSNDMDFISNVISKSIFVLSMRLHGCILSANCGIPTFGFKNIEKINAFLFEIKNDDCYLSNFDNNDIILKLDYIINDYENQKSIFLHNKQVREKTSRDELEKII